MTETGAATREERIEASADLREFLRQAEAAGELERVKGADPHLEMGALYELSLKKLYPPVLLFEEIKGCDPAFRVLSNLRTAKFLVGSLDLEAVQAFRKRPKGPKGDPIPPQEVNTGPVMDCVETGDAVDLSKFPAPRWHEGDGGNYIGTECVNIVKDPDSEWVNLGTYRVMVQDKTTLGVFIEPGKHADVIRRKYWAQGKPCPMAISVGQAPILGVAAAAPAKPGESEYALAGSRIGRPIRVVRGTITGLPIPADAELVFEGFMPPPSEDARPEGPFGEWPGYYASDGGKEPVLHVKAVYHRKDAIVIGQPPAKPTLPGRQHKISRIAMLWDQIEAAGVPGVTGVWKMQGAGSRFIDIVRIKQLHPGHAKMAGLVAAGCGAGSYMTRMVVVVDDDIDITDSSEVMWALATRWDPKTQTDIIDGCWTGKIDPVLTAEKRETGDLTTSRMIVYAVKPYHWKDAFPKVNAVSRDYAEEVQKKWAGKLAFLRS
ncbi:MAG TPA: UbiD family decarboxylase [Alphaproteobacteria bacterium]|nr:UbiD family decarboxylase [Alphaproteobacteria bacterium]